MKKIGQYTVYSIETGRFFLDGGAMFGVVPRPLWEKRIAPDSRNRIPMAMRCLLIEGEGRLMLVDAGLGHKYDDRFAGLYAIDHETATLERSLNQYGFSSRDVTDVFLTHLHFDHVGGCTRREDERLVLTFPYARHHVQKAHWMATQNPNPREKASFFAENLNPLAEQAQLILHHGPATLGAGISSRVFHGHTDAQQILLIEGDEGGLAYVADLIPTQHHLAAAWTMGYDVRPLVTMDEKGTFLEEACQKGWRLFLEHDPTDETIALERTSKGVVALHPAPLASV